MNSSVLFLFTQNVFVSFFFFFSNVPLGSTTVAFYDLDFPTPSVITGMRRALFVDGSLNLIPVFPFFSLEHGEV